jgi:hypothetical protein
MLANELIIMAINKFIHIVSSPFSQRDYVRYGIDMLRADGFDVEVWNVGKLVNKYAYEKCANVSGKFELEEVFNTKNEFLKRLRRIGPAFFFSAVPYHSSSLFLYRGLSSSAQTYSISVSYPLSAWVKAIGAGETKVLKQSKARFFERLKGISFKKISYKVISTVPLWLFGIRHADIVFSGGFQSSFLNPLIGLNTRVMNIHVNDYDIFLDNPQSEPCEEKYAVFIDQNLPLNTDPLYTKSTRVVTENNYFPSVTQFFNEIEKELGMPVKIAVHPRADYGSIPGLFGGRELLQGETARLVNGSSLVIAHYSYAVNFAVLYRKPLIFITTNELKASFRRVATEAISSHFDKDPINVDCNNEIDWKCEMTVDTRLYDQYIFNFIKQPGTPKRLFWQVVGERAKQLLGDIDKKTKLT